MYKFPLYALLNPKPTLSISNHICSRYIKNKPHKYILARILISHNIAFVYYDHHSIYVRPIAN